MSLIPNPFFGDSCLLPTHYKPALKSYLRSSCFIPSMASVPIDKVGVYKCDFFAMSHYNVCCINEEASVAAEADVLKALSQITDPVLGTDIVTCGFVNDLHINQELRTVSFRLKLTRPEHPVIDLLLKMKAQEVVDALPWVSKVTVDMSVQLPRVGSNELLPRCLQNISNFVAVSSYRGGVGQSTVAMSLACSLARIGKKVGIFDANVNHFSLHNILPSSENPPTFMKPRTGTIIPHECRGIKMVSLGLVRKSCSLIRGAMVSGAMEQLLTTTEWGNLTFLIIDMPPATGTEFKFLIELLPFIAVVFVTKPQEPFNSRGIPKFREEVPCIALVENMSYFVVNGIQHHPLGNGFCSKRGGALGIPHVCELPIIPSVPASVSVSGSGVRAMFEVLEAHPSGAFANAVWSLGLNVANQCTKIGRRCRLRSGYDISTRTFRFKVAAQNVGDNDNRLQGAA